MRRRWRKCGCDTEVVPFGPSHKPSLKTEFIQVYPFNGKLEESGSVGLRHSIQERNSHYEKVRVRFERGHSCCGLRPSGEIEKRPCFSFRRSICHSNGWPGI